MGRITTVGGVPDGNDIFNFFFYQASSLGVTKEANDNDTKTEIMRGWTGNGSGGLFKSYHYGKVQY